ncbi:MAG: polyketide synthase dehydratase domain-containing protein, partial [Arenicella sp.]|nr:polyketide synthase dehydratase domain-containing protein [Arenicella sp.]
SMLSDQGGFVDGIEKFDSKFFGISDKEAMFLDPQQRMLMECGWEALEHAGIVPSTLQDSSTGVFTGSCNHDYSVLSWLEFDDIYIGTGTSNALAANRLSYFLKLNGPSINVDTACSSSLTALHLACSSIHAGEIDCALVGGSNLLLLPAVNCSLSKAGLLSKTGRCHSFGEQANGYVRSEGAGVIVIMSASKAQRESLNVICTIKATGSNHNGASNGLMAPSPRAQKALFESVYGGAGLNRHKVRYLEAAATGTQVGDAIEMKAIQDYFGTGREGKDGPLRVGSVKSNVGHLEGAGGIAAVIKAALIIDKGIVPASLHSQSLNPMIKLADNIRIPQCSEPLAHDSSENELGTLVGVSSFGFGGSNSHVVIGRHAENDDLVEGHVELAQHSCSNHEQGELEREANHPILLSAKTPAALREAAERLISWIDNNTEKKVKDIAFTYARHREHFPHRLACLANTTDKLTQDLRSLSQSLDVTVTAVPPAKSPSLSLDYEHASAVQWLCKLNQDKMFKQCLSDDFKLLNTETGYGIDELFSSPDGTAREAGAYDKRTFLVDYLLLCFLRKLLPNIKRYMVSSDKLLPTLVAIGELSLQQGLTFLAENVEKKCVNSPTDTVNHLISEKLLPRLPKNVQLIHNKEQYLDISSDWVQPNIELKRGELLIGIGPEPEPELAHSQHAPSIRFFGDSGSGLPELIKAIFEKQVKLDLSDLFNDSVYQLLELPGYSFQRRHFWPNSVSFSPHKEPIRLGRLANCLDGIAVTQPYKGIHWFEYSLSTTHSSLLADHVILDFPVVAASTQLMLVAKQLQKMLKPNRIDDSSSITLNDLVLHTALLLSHTDAVTTRLLIDNEDNETSQPAGPQEGVFQLLSERGEQWEEHLGGSWRTGADRLEMEHDSFPESASSTLVEGAEIIRFYDELVHKGYAFGPHHRWLRSVKTCGDWAEGRIETQRDAMFDLAPLSPGIVDTAFHLLEFLAKDGGSSGLSKKQSDTIALPVAVGSMQFDFDGLKRMPEKIWVHLKRFDDTERVADVYILDAENKPQVVLSTVVFRCVDKAILARHWRGMSDSTSASNTDSEHSLKLQRDGLSLSAQIIDLLDRTLGIALPDEQMTLPLRELGVDSLKAMEIAQLIKKYYGHSLSLKNLMTDLSPNQLVSLVEASVSSNDAFSLSAVHDISAQSNEENFNVMEIIGNEEVIMELEL